MKKLFILLAAISLTGCDTVRQIALPSATEATAVSDKVVLEGARYFLIAQDGYQAAANSAATLIRSGVWKPNDGQKAMLNSLNDNALKLIEGTDKSLSFAQRTAGLLTIANQINSIIGRK